jgi:hypothetical protein
MNARYTAFYVVLTPKGYVGRSTFAPLAGDYRVVHKGVNAGVARREAWVNAGVARREAWWLDFGVSPPTQVPGRPIDFVDPQGAALWAGLLPDAWLDLEQNLRGSDGKVIFQGPGNFPAVDSAAGLSAPVTPSGSPGSFPLL